MCLSVPIAKLQKFGETFPNHLSQRVVNILGSVQFKLYVAWHVVPSEV